MDPLSDLEDCLLPAPVTAYWNGGDIRYESCTTTQKVAHYVKNFFTFIALLIALPFTLTYSWIQQKPPVPQTRTEATSPMAPPDQHGFATSLFQTSGLGTKWSATEGLKGRCDWDEWMTPERIKAEEHFDYKDFFTDILGNAESQEKYIGMLKDHHVTAHRFSLEWSVLQPEKGAEFDPKAVELYRNFITNLKTAGIIPSVTLNHFVIPDWFYNADGFQNKDNIDHYVEFAKTAITTFTEVKDWWSFNELGVKAFQQAREVYPTKLEGKSLGERVHAAGIATRNMLIAHCKLDAYVRENCSSDTKVGVTHQWLKFDTENGNWLERTMAYFFTKFGFTPVYEFFKDGHFRFQFPFMANIHFKVEKPEFEKNGKFLMRLGVQAYPQPMLKMGLNGGRDYPGVPGGVKKFGPFTFGSTCEPGGTVMRFGPRHMAARMGDILDEAFALTDQVYITEFGSDAAVRRWRGDKVDENFVEDEQTQANYLQELVDQVKDYMQKNSKRVLGIFAWSDLRNQMEWENGFECKLGLIRHTVNDKRQMTGWTPTKGSEVIERTYEAFKGAIPAAA